jgi:hypothetical protein
MAGSTSIKVTPTDIQASNGTAAFTPVSDSSVITRISGDTRYIKNGSTHGNLTVSDSPTFPNSAASVLSLADGLKYIEDVVSAGGTRTDSLLVNATDATKRDGTVIATSSAGTAIQRIHYTGFPTKSKYAQISLTCTDTAADVTLEVRSINDTAPAKTWTTNSILTQGYADTRYNPQIKSVNSAAGVLSITPANSETYKVVLTENTSISFASVMSHGRVTIIVDQPATPKTIALGAFIKTYKGFNAATDLGQAANERTLLEFVSDGVNMLLVNARVFV